MRRAVETFAGSALAAMALFCASSVAAQAPTHANVEYARVNNAPLRLDRICRRRR